MPSYFFETYTLESPRCATCSSARSSENALSIYLRLVVNCQKLNILSSMLKHPRTSPPVGNSCKDIKGLPIIEDGNLVRRCACLRTLAVSKANGMPYVQSRLAAWIS